MSAHVPAYRLLELVNGELEPDRGRAVINHTEGCADCAAALRVLVTLKANRVEALEALRAAESDAAARGPAYMSGLRFAVIIAVVGALAAWWLFAWLGA